jgi:hypothetical protein
MNERRIRIQILLTLLLEIVCSFLTLLVSSGTVDEIESGWVGEIERIVANVGVQIPLLRIDKFRLHYVYRVGGHSEGCWYELLSLATLMIGAVTRLSASTRR